MKMLKRRLAMVLILIMVFSNIPAEKIFAAEESRVKILETKTTEDIESSQCEEEKTEELLSKEEMIEESVVSGSESAEVTEIENLQKKPEEILDTKEEAVFEQRLNYVYVESPYLETPGRQNIVVSWGDGTEDIEDMRIVLENSKGNEEEWVSTKHVGKLYLFTKEYNGNEKDEYEVTKIKLVQGGIAQEWDFEDISNVSANFGINKEYEGYGENLVQLADESVAISEEDIEATVVNVNESGKIESENDIVEALKAANREIEAVPITARARLSERSSETVVVLDPGHDATHAGAGGNGLREEVLTLKIAKYTKEELEKLGNARVYMVRDEACPYPGTTSGECNAKRVEAAKEQGATIYVSFHLNSSTSSAAAGAEIIHPNMNWNPEIGEEGEKLAEIIQKELVSLGLKNRGIYSKSTQIDTYPDGSKRDYYQIPRLCKEAGFPGIIIEHAFITNRNDANQYLKTESGLKKLGKADADGIIKYLESTGRWITKGGKKYYSVGGKLVKGEKRIDGKWYYFDEKDGAMQTGFVQLSNKTAYYSNTGEMVYGEQKINDKWHYFKPGNGAMQKSTFVQLANKRVYYDEKGQMVYGPKTIEGKEFYFEYGNGKQRVGFFESDKGIIYYLESGGYGYGEQRVNNKWYHFDEKTGLMTKGLKDLTEKTVYYNDNGEMYYGEKKIGDKWYYFKPGNGAMQKSTFIQLANKRVYYDEKGQMVYGPKTIEGKEFYFEYGNGKQRTGFVETNKGIIYYLENGGCGYGEQRVNNKWYHFDEKTGFMSKGLKDLIGKTVYYNDSGEMHYGEKKIGDKWYYFKPGNGAMQKSTFVLLPGKMVYYDVNGVMQYGEQKVNGKWYYFKEGTGKMMTNIWINGFYYNEQGIRQ